MRRQILAVMMLLAAVTSAGAADPVPAYDPVPVGPSAPASAVRGVLFARPFTLETPYAYTWTAEQTSITSGYVLVVEVEPELARVKSTWNPVLYAGRYPAEITSSDPETGRVVVIVPGDLDLSRDPVFFGSVELPDRVTAERGRQELAAARAAGYAPLTAEALRLALQAGGERATLRDAGYLYGGPVADAIERYVPSQASVADGYRVPRVETR